MNTKIIKKIKTKVKQGKIVVIVKLFPELVINPNQTDLLTKKYKNRFFALGSLKKNKLVFSNQKGISLSNRLKNPLSKYDFFFIIEQIVDTVKKIEKEGLLRNNFIIDLNYVYFNEVTKELSFVYLPIVSCHANIDVITLIEQVIYAAKPAEKQQNYLAEFNCFIKHLEQFDAEKIESYISMIDQSIVDLISDENFGRQYPSKNNSVEGNKAGKTNDEQTDIMSDDDKTDLMPDIDQMDLMIDNDQTDLMENDELANTLSNGLDNNVFIENNNDESTCLLNDNEAINLSETGQNTKNKFPVLVRSFTEEVIRINKPVFRIGKDENCVDYVVTNNIAISRSHADIISRNGRYFVFDLRSKNKSYINNRVLPTEQEVEIFNGDVLKLANEDFLFQV